MRYKEKEKSNKKKKKKERAGWKKNRRKTKKQAKMAKLKIWDKKRVGEGTGKIWYLKYKISEALETKLKKMQQWLPYPQLTRKDCERWRENKGILRVGGKRMWDDHWRENWFYVSECGGGEMVKVWIGNKL